MALKESGIELVAKDADKFVRDITNVNKSYKALNKMLFDTIKSFSNFDKEVGEAGSTVVAFAKSSDLAGKSLGELEADAKGLTAQVKQLTPGTDAFIKKSAELKTVNSRIKELRDTFRAVPKSIDAAGNSLAELREESKRLTKELENLDRASPEFEDTRQELARVTSEVIKFRKESRQAAKDAEQFADGSYQQLNRRLTQLKESYRQLSGEARKGLIGQQQLAEIQKLDQQLKGIDKTLGQSQRNVGNYQSALEGLTSFLPSLQTVALGAFTAAAAAAVQFSNQSIEAFKAFETGFNEVLTLQPNLSGSALVQFKDQTIDLQTEIGRTSGELLPALYASLSAGVPPGNVFDFLEIASKAATAGVTDLETAVDAITGVVNATASLGEGAISAAEASDILFTTVRLGKTTLPELSASISDITKASISSGLAFEESAAALATLTSQIGNTSQSATQFKSLTDELTAAAGAGKVFSELTGQGFAQFIESGGTLQEALRILADEAERTNTPLNNLFSSSEAAGAALILAGSGAESFAANLVETQNAIGAADEAASRFTDSLLIAEKQTAAQAEALKLAVGEALAPYRKEWEAVKLSVLEAATEFTQVTVTQKELGESFKETRDLLALAAKDLQGFSGGMLGANDVIGEVSRTLDGFGGILTEQEDKLNRSAIALQLVERGLVSNKDELVNQIIAIEKSFGTWENYTQQVETATGKTADLVFEEQGLILSQEQLAQSAEVAEKSLRAQGQAIEDLSTETEQAARTNDEFADKQTQVNNRLSESEARIQEAGRRWADYRQQVIAAEQAQRVLNDAINSAISSAGGRFIESISPTTSGGGGSAGPSPAEILERELGEIRREEADKLADTERQNRQSLADLTAESEKKIAEQRARDEESIATLRESSQKQIAQAEQALIDARKAAEAEFQRQRAQTFLGALGDDEEFDPQEQAREFLQLAAAQGRSAEELAEIAVATGAATEEEVKAAFAATQRQEALESLARASTLTAQEQAEAIALINEQIAAGQEVDLSQFGVTIETQAEFVENRTRQQAAELESIRKESADKIAEAEQQNAQRIIEIQEDATKRRIKLEEDAAKRIVAIQEEANKRSAEAVQQSAEDQATATGGAAQAVDDLSKSYEAQYVQQLLNQAAQEGDIELKQELINQAFELAVQTGLLTEEEANRQQGLIELDTQTQLLFGSTSQLNESIRDGETAATTQQQALQLLTGGYVATAEQAISLAGTLNADLVGAFQNARDRGLSVKEALDEIGISADELPDEVTIDIKADDQATQTINSVQRGLDSLPREVTIKINAEAEGQAIQGGQQTGLDSPQPQGFARGGVVRGGRQFIQVNEEGPEAVLNAEAVRILGASSINALNAGNIGQALNLITGVNPQTPLPVNIMRPSQVDNSTSIVNNIDNGRTLNVSGELGRLAEIVGTFSGMFLNG